MTTSGMTIIARPTTRLEAEGVVAYLATEGINALISVDDVGGLMPSLATRKRVLVADADAAQALLLLANAAEHLHLVEDSEAESLEYSAYVDDTEADPPEPSQG